MNRLTRISVAGILATLMVVALGGPATAAVESTPLETVIVEPRSTGSALGAFAPSADSDLGLSEEEIERLIAEFLASAGAPQQRSAPTSTVQCYGDSLLASVCPTANSPLATSLPGWSIKAHSTGGNTSTAVAVTAGAYVLAASESFTIPVEGVVDIAAPAGLPVTPEQFGSTAIQVDIAGIPAMLVHQPVHGYNWRIVTQQLAEPVTIEAGTPLTSRQSMQPGAQSIIWAGTNNVTATAQVIADIGAMVALHQSVSVEPFWVVSVTPAWGNNGSIYGISRNAINRQLEALYAESYVPLDDYLGNGAITNAGRVPTGADRSWISMGLNPPVFHRTATDWVHFNALAQQTIATYLSRFVTGALSRTSAVAEFTPNASVKATANRGGITVRGWAYDHSDLYQPISVGVTIDGVWVGATLADRPSPELARWGVPGGRGFEMTLAAQAGPRTVCFVAVNIGAGAHRYPACQRVIVPPTMQGDMAVVQIGAGTVAVVGWAFDHTNLYASIPVAVIINGAWRGAPVANHPSPYLYPYGVPGSHAFFTAAGLPPGVHTACAVAVGIAGGHQIVGCQTFTVHRTS